MSVPDSNLGAALAPDSSEKTNRVDGGFARAWWFVAAIVAAIYFAAHMITATRYGYFRDALYYLACSQHLDWGYVDQPPLIALVAWIARHTLGTSLRALLLWPALAGCGRILLTAAFARELGAKRFGIALAATLAAAPAVWIAIDHQFAMNAFEPLFWTGCAFVLLRMIQTGDVRLWVLFGAIGGLGLENKYSIGFFAAALLLGLLLTPQRRLLWTPWVLAGGGVALVIFLPNLLWNIHHHWPFLELMRNIRASGKDVALPPLPYLGQQALMMAPQTLPFWLAGLGFYFFSRRATAYRAFGWAFAFTITFFLVMHGKDYYSAPAYPMVLAAGAVATEMFFDSARFAARSKLRTRLRGATFRVLVIASLVMSPLVLPVLPIDTFVAFQKWIGIEPPRTERNQIGVLLPQYYADEFGWPEMVEQVARVYHSLPPDQQRKTAIYTANYGEAGAIDFFGPRYGLPKAICAHQSYFFWGPREYTGEIMILVGSANIEEARPHFASIEIVPTLSNRYAMPHEQHPILLARGLRADLHAIWPTLKNWN
ncbi:MAG TPA: glycosyltransferase family 39 protein [Candidatus Sulfotelmatobacter sp.]|nr:glycosyltransferase family 39 protein [Candidatus Sulfotelmatobacter sp.]